MRTTEFKIGKEKTEAVLVAGGPGFKIYTAEQVRGWILAIGRNRIVVDEALPEFQTISRYVNLRYQPIAMQSSIKSEFDLFIQTLIQKQAPPEATP